MQREHISALMDGESLDSDVLQRLERDHSLQQTWERYHLVRDLLRGDTGHLLHLDISSRVMAAIASENPHSAQADNVQPDNVQADNTQIDNTQADNVVPFISEQQPLPAQWQKPSRWQNFALSKLNHSLSYLGQISVAACVSLAVILGVQHYSGNSAVPSAENPVFNTLPMMGQATPVSLGVPAQGIADSGQQRLQEQRRRISAYLQDYELQRRLYSEQHSAQLDQQNPAQQNFDQQPLLPQNPVQQQNLTSTENDQSGYSAQ